MALVPLCAFGVDGAVLINQSTVTAAGGFRYKITQPGSYRLSGNLTAPDANTTAIQVLADGVTIEERQPDIRIIRRVLLRGLTDPGAGGSMF